MRAIVTGVTSGFAKGSNRVGFEPLSTGLRRLLEHAGWEVEHRPMMVESNEQSLRDADLLVMGMSPVNAVGSRFLVGALDALSMAKRLDCAVLFAIDDWQTQLLKTSVRTMAKRPWNVTKWFNKSRTDFLWGAHHTDRIAAMLTALDTYEWPGCLVPSHPWRTDNAGPITDSVPSRRHYFFDPTSFTAATRACPPPLPPGEKKREWVLAALGDYEPWVVKQEFGWPVRYYGGKTFRRDDAGRAEDDAFRSTRVPETEVQQRYAESWGGLSPKHKLAGVGAWWRTRFYYTVQSGAVLWGDPLEMHPIGPSFRCTAHQVEAMTDAELFDLNRAQVSEMAVDPPDKAMAVVLRAARDAFGDIGKRWDWKPRTPEQLAAWEEWGETGHGIAVPRSSAPGAAAAAAARARPAARSSRSPASGPPEAPAPAASASAAHAADVPAVPSLRAPAEAAAP